MSSLLALLREAPEEEGAARRWVTLVPEDPGTGAPSLELLIELMDAETLDRIAQKFRKKTELGLMFLLRPMGGERASFCKTWGKMVVKGWKGWGRANAFRVSAEALRKPTVVKSWPDDIAFSDEVRDEFAVMLDVRFILDLNEMASDRDGFYAALLEKKDSVNAGSD